MKIDRFLEDKDIKLLKKYKPDIEEFIKECSAEDFFDELNYIISLNGFDKTQNYLTSEGNRLQCIYDNVFTSLELAELEKERK